MGNPQALFHCCSSFRECFGSPVCSAALILPSREQKSAFVIYSAGEAKPRLGWNAPEVTQVLSQQQECHKWTPLGRISWERWPRAGNSFYLCCIKANLRPQCILRPSCTILSLNPAFPRQQLSHGLARTRAVKWNILGACCQPEQFSLCLCLPWGRAGLVGRCMGLEQAGN